MATWVEIEAKIRRFLRDPNHSILSTEQLLGFWNSAQSEIQSKTHVLERIEAHRYPPAYTFSYLHEWEYVNAEGDRYRALSEWQERDDTVVSYPWETAYWLASSSTPDSGSRCIHPWEAGHCSPADVVPLLLHADFHRMKFAAYDCEEILPITEREASKQDRYYRTTTGEVSHYWRPDIQHNHVVLYPRPGTVVFQEPPEDYESLSDDGTGIYTDTDGLVSYMFSWELTSSHLPTGKEKKITETYGDGNASEIECLYGWEVIDSGGTESWEDVGGLVSSDDSVLDAIDTGMVTDILDPGNSLLVIYEPIPAPISCVDDVIVWPEWMLRYVEYATLERAFGADTDCFIPTLRDYWRMRKEQGIEALKRFVRMRLKDREFRLGGGYPHTTRSRLRLPAGYPAVYP